MSIENETDIDKLRKMRDATQQQMKRLMKSGSSEKFTNLSHYLFQIKLRIGELKRAKKNPSNQN